MEDQGRQALLKRPREEDETHKKIPPTAFGTKAAPPVSKRSCAEPKPVHVEYTPEGIKVGVVGGWDFTGWTCLLTSRRSVIRPLPEVEEEDFVAPGVWDPEEDDPYGVTFEMIDRRKAELKGEPLNINDPLFTTRIFADEWHPYPFLVGNPSIGNFYKLTASEMAAARAFAAERAAAAAADSDVSASVSAAAPVSDNN